MIRHDLTHWPLVLSSARGAMMIDDQIAFLAEWNHWLDRDEPFAALRVFADEAAHQRPQGVAYEIKAWLEANSARLKRLLLGVATVVTPDYHERLSRMNAERLFGAPARMFIDKATALDWIDDVVLRPRLVRIDRRMILRSLEGP